MSSSVENHCEMFFKVFEIQPISSHGIFMLSLNEVGIHTIYLCFYFNHNHANEDREFGAEQFILRLSSYNYMIIPITSSINFITE